MHRHMFVHVIISLAMVLVVFGALPLTAAGASNAPAGVTETPGNTPVPPATNTPVPAATNTPVPAATNTPVPAATNTPVPLPTNTPGPTRKHTEVPTPENTPVATPVDTPVSAPAITPFATPATTPTAPTIVGLPNTGGAGPQSGGSPWTLLWVATVVGSLSVLAFGLSFRSRRPTRR